MYGEPKNYPLRGKVPTTRLISKKSQVVLVMRFLFHRQEMAYEQFMDLVNYSHFCKIWRERFITKYKYA